MITQMSFMSPDELPAVEDTLETWSQICLRGLKEMAERRKSAVQIDTK